MAFLPLIAAAADAPLAFPDVKLSVPPLSLVGSSQQEPPPLANGIKMGDQTMVALQPSDPWMPIKAGSSECDPKMVKAPNPSIDYRLIIKNPDLSLPR
jgi:hypothetical protein